MTLQTRKGKPREGQDVVRDAKRERSRNMNAKIPSALSAGRDLCLAGAMGASPVA